MSLHILANDEHYVTAIRLNKPYALHEVPRGLAPVTWDDVDKIPATYVPHCYWTDAPGIFVTDTQAQNPFAYKAQQHEVFAWARKNIHDPAYLAYGLRGNAERADIFHVFTVVNVLAALTKENITGDNWGIVQRNMVSWQDFTNRIRVSDWTNRLRFNYVDFLESPMAVFPKLRSGSDFRGVMDGSGILRLDIGLLSQTREIIPNG